VRRGWGIFAGFAVFLRGVWKKWWVDGGFFVVIVWWICGETWWIGGA
jgi:hypothetical protein